MAHFGVARHKIILNVQEVRLEYISFGRLEFYSFA